MIAIPDKDVGPKEEQEEKEKLQRLSKILTLEEKTAIVQDALLLKKH